MSEEKSEAQLRNEAEVKRILEERGYSSTSSKKATEKALSDGFSFKKFLIGFIVMALLIGGGGWAYFQFFAHKDNSEPEETASIKHYYDDEDDADFVGFENCLNAVDKSEVSLDDPEFWNKYISRYESMISCYNQYPGIGSDYDKNKLQETLSQYQDSRDQVIANEVEYQARMAQIDAELEQSLAEIKAKSEAWDAELAQRVQEQEAESNAMHAQWEAERQAREEKEAKCNAFESEYPDVETYKSKNGNLDELWNNYKEAESEYLSALNAYGHSNPNHSDEWREAIWKGVEAKEKAYNAAHNAWSSTNANLSSRYFAEHQQICY